MTNKEILKADLLDLVFDNRNKQYGAYLLRKTYPQRLLIAVTFTALTATGVLWFAGMNSITDAPDQPLIPDLVFDQVDFTPKTEEPVQPPEQPAPSKPSEPVATAQYTDKIEIVKDDVLPETTFPPVSELENKAIGTKLVDGAAFDGGQQPQTESSNGPGTETVPVVEADVPIDAERVEVMAEFPGGMDAFRRYIGDRLTGSETLEPGVRQMVKVRFVIGKDGLITDIVVVSSGGKVLDRSVTRVLQQAPRWKPARQNGREVAVVYTLPVTFMGGED